MQTVLKTGSGPVEEHYAVGAVEVIAGGARAEANLGPWARLRDGRFAPGIMGPLVDMAWSHAVLSHRPDGQWGVSTEISIDFVADPSADGRLTATGEMLSVDAAGGAARGEVRSETNELIALGTLWSTFIKVPPPSTTAGGETAESDEHEVSAQRPDCFEDLVDLRSVEGKLMLVRRPRMTNPLGVGHGGALFAAASLAAMHALGPTDARLESLRGVYVRQAVGDVTFTSEVLHAGRRFATVQVTATGADGRPAVHFTAAMRAAQ